MTINARESVAQALCVCRSILVIMSERWEEEVVNGQAMQARDVDHREKEQDELGWS